jgi:RNA polymerase sigma-70 factor (ECF subfamily)
MNPPSPAADTARDDAALMALAARDPAQFAPLYERYVSRVYAYCLRRAGSTQEAEDLCSQVFTQALTHLHTWRGGMVAAWLFQIAHNTVVNHYRGRRSLVALDDVDLWDEGMTDAFDLAEDARIVKTLVADLTDDQRHLLSLTLDAGLSSQEAGVVLGKSAGAVRVQLHRTIKHLRDRYERLVEGRSK